MNGLLGTRLVLVSLDSPNEWVYVGISGTYSDDEIEAFNPPINHHSYSTYNPRRLTPCSAQAMPYTRKQKALNFWAELKALLVTGLLGMPCGILIFLPFYHWPHDIFHVSSEVMGHTPEAHMQPTAHLSPYDWR